VNGEHWLNDDDHRVNDLDLTITATTGREYSAFARRHLLAAHRVLHPPLCELSIAFVGDARMSELHERFMNISGPTDVLTFPLEQNNRGQITSGEVVVCIPQAKRQSKLRSIPVQREVLLYALHGMLHLCGFDDRTPAEFKKMHAMEDKILSRIGVGATFKHSPRRIQFSGRNSRSNATSAARLSSPKSEADPTKSARGKR
jgi:rRNA maturation RNase YbeY